MYTLSHLGWSDFQDQHFQEFKSSGFLPGRISNEQRGHYYLLAEQGEFRVEPSGKVLFSIDSPSELPKVGDWVAFQPYSDDEGIVHSVLRRRTQISRKDPGGDTEQVIATNLDVLFIMQGLDRDFNPARLERYVLMAQSGGVHPVVLLNKADLVDDVQPYRNKVQAIAPDEDIIVLSALEGQSVEQVLKRCASGITAALVGSSGVGKSTLVNYLLGTQLQETKSVREDDARGRHTTTSRSLFMLPSGGLLIDTPGMRELAPWADNDSLSLSFAEIEELGSACKYKDCTHKVEAGCAVLEGVENGILDRRRYENWLKLQKELDYLSNTDSYLERKEQLYKGYRELHRKMYKGRKE